MTAPKRRRKPGKRAAPAATPPACQVVQLEVTEGGFADALAHGKRAAPEAYRAEWDAHTVAWQINRLCSEIESLHRQLQVAQRAGRRLPSISELRLPDPDGSTYVCYPPPWFWTRCAPWAEPAVATHVISPGDGDLRARAEIKRLLGIRVPTGGEP